MSNWIPFLVLTDLCFGFNQDILNGNRIFLVSLGQRVNSHAHHLVFLVKRAGKRKQNHMRTVLI